METQTQIEKLKEEYERLLQELKGIEAEHTIIVQEHKELNQKILNIRDKIDDLDDEVIRLNKDIRDKEKEYIENQEVKVIGITTGCTLIITILLLSIFGKMHFLYVLLVSAITTSVIGPLISCTILTRKTWNKFRNKYEQTEEYIKEKELIDQKIKEINELKTAKVSLGDTDELYKKLSNLEKQIETKQKELEETRQKVIEIFFGDTKEESTKVEIAKEQVIPSHNEVEEKYTPLVKTRRIFN